jgi:hypothetical protein
MHHYMKVKERADVELPGNVKLGNRLGWVISSDSCGFVIL